MAPSAIAACLLSSLPVLEFNETSRQVCLIQSHSPTASPAYINPQLAPQRGWRPQTAGRPTTDAGFQGSLHPSRHNSFAQQQPFRFQLSLTVLVKHSRSPLASLTSLSPPSLPFPPTPQETPSPGLRILRPSSPLAPLSFPKKRRNGRPVRRPHRRRPLLRRLRARRERTRRRRRRASAAAASTTCSSAAGSCSCSRSRSRSAAAASTRA